MLLEKHMTSLGIKKNTGHEIFTLCFKSSHFDRKYKEVFGMSKVSFGSFKLVLDNFIVIFGNSTVVFDICKVALAIPK